MKEYTITVLDTTGIQSYIFGSNKLRENIGASHLVKQATDDWVRNILVDMGVPKEHQQDPIEQSNWIAEIVYAGGGNAMVLFKSKCNAMKFTKKLSRTTLKDAPGINLVVAHQKFDWDKDKLHEVVSDLMKNELEQQKYKRIPSAPLLGLGVTAVCNSTQLVAVDSSNNPKYKMPSDDEPYLISREIGAKLIAAPQANDELRETFANFLDQYEFPLRTDQMGRSREENSYVAVVHADGNSMGKRFREYGKKQSEQYPEDPNRVNRAYVEAMRNLSESVDQAGKQALKKVIEILVKSIQEVTENGRTVKKVVGQLGEFEIEGNYLPFRPLVYGGDDVTFVCDGRLGIELAAIYLNELEQPKMPDGKHIKACAGISIVKTHYPFARAYELSEALCREAKRLVKASKEFEPEGFSALDWHIASSGLSGSISEIRKREYKVSLGELCMRPIRLKIYSDEWQNWEGFTKVVKEFINGGDWRERKNKILALREVLREGKDAIEQFLNNYKLTKLPLFIPEFSRPSRGLATDGWLNGVCGYFDAIEAMEFYLSIEKDESVSTEDQITK